MGSEFTFCDYIDADGGGTNTISDWLNGLGKDAKGYFANLIPILEESSPRGYQDSNWKGPHIKRMKGEWKGFTEFRRTGRVQYRLLGQIDGRNVLLVAGAIHKEQNYTTTVSAQTALNRVNQMKNNPARYRREHEYN